jgi:hypothetical protein
MSDILASASAMESLWDVFPKGRFVGVTGQIPHEQVIFIGDLLDSSGVPTLIDSWQNEDRTATAPGGRPRTVSTRTVLILFLLLSVEHTAQLVEEMAFIAFQRLSKESLDYLGLSGASALSRGKRRTKKQWYFVCWRALHRALVTIDPRPIATTERGKFPTKTEVEAMKKGWESTDLQSKHDRLKLVCSSLLEATMQLVPKQYADTWSGDTCVDASVIPAYAKRGAPFGTDRGSIEPTAGWYRRDSNHKIPTDAKKVKKSIYGWDATVIVQTNHEPAQLAEFPQLIVGMGLTVPGRNLIGTATELYEDIVLRRGHRPGRATGDRGYSAGAKPEDYQIPLRRLGYDLVGDYNKTQLGKDSGAEYEGAIQVEGSWYCPSMPTGLVNATKLYRAGTITHTTWRKRITQRRKYMFRPKEKPDAEGRVPWMCPARGPGATALCPLVETCSSTPDQLTPVAKPPAPNKQGKACTNKTSITIPITAGAKHAQAMQHESDEWRVIYKSDRNTIEGTNGFFKDSAKEAVGDAGRRRLRGIAAQQLSICLLFVTVNLRKIQKFRDELVNHTPADQQVRAGRKLAVRKQRRSRDDRQAPWDNFTKRSEYEDSEDPPEEDQLDGD